MIAGEDGVDGVAEMDEEVVGILEEVCGEEDDLAPAILGAMGEEASTGIKVLVGGDVAGGVVFLEGEMGK